ncbi:hypothetical protein DSAG12_00519 [Promethearchaeum syntrophicum]|uniref:Uncharacterized protein n=1 Tax=Promethearchaeum syntrophicum TaxID=2594042 RepID=A0A5B9D6R4_9ARCH|nr:hypothetical protein [Candidatus Prometheoarchaeum syntrophicum]QEE14705.1 hypothetical protein DSAG12_00519 [Candidatus Prometheoarchaeum syntrophicum]
MFRKKKEKKKEIIDEKNGKAKSKSFIYRLFSIVSYVILLGIGLIVGYFVKIPIEISYAILFIFGILAVALNLDENKMHWLKQIPLLRHHFSLMNRINKKIGESAKAGTLKEAFKFLIGMFMLILYLFLFNIFIILIRLILSIGIPDTDPLRFVEAFITLIGAGITAYVVWLIAFYKEIKMLKKREVGSLKKKIMKKVKSGLGFVNIYLKLIPLSLAYLVWITGEILFMLGSNLAGIALIVYILGGTLYGLLIICIICIIFLTKAPKLTDESTIEINSKEEHN